MRPNWRRRRRRRASTSAGRASAQILLELAARTGERKFDAAEVHRLKTDYLKARIRYFEATAEGARRRATLARDRARLGLLPASDLDGFERAANDAALALDAERKTLTRHEAERPAPPRKRSARARRSNPNLDLAKAQTRFARLDLNGSRKIAPPRRFHGMATLLFLDDSQ